MTRIAVIGAGLAGLTLTRRLQDIAEVRVFEKSRGSGGRMATRTTAAFEFDHGAQFFTAKSAEFQSEVADWVEHGVAARWYPHFAEFECERVIATRRWADEHPHYVGVPAMKAIGRHLAEQIDVQLETTIQTLERRADGWCLGTADGKEFAGFEWVISTAPPAQTAALLPDIFTHHRQLSTIRMLGCYALMLGFRTPPDLDWQAALVKNADISWVSVNSSKPDRPNHEEHCTLVVHSTNAFAQEHIDSEADTVKAHLLDEVERITGVKTGDAAFIDMQRWRYANIGPQSGQTSMLDTVARLGACGDWCVRGRVEAAFTSATDMARTLRSQL